MKSCIVIITALVAFSCEKKCVLPVFGIGGGEIIPNALISLEMITGEMKDQAYLLNTAEDNAFNLQVSFDGGQTYGPIDFNLYTVLGKYAEGQCETSFERTVSPAGSVHLYSIKVHQCGKCESLNTSMNWVLVPKIPSGHSVQFIVL